MLTHDYARLLVFGPAMWRADAERSGQQPMVVAELPDDEATVSTTVLDWADLGPCHLHQLPQAEPGHDAATRCCAPPLLTPSLRPGPGWAALAEQCWPSQRPVPLLLLTRHGRTVLAHSLVRLDAERAVFARVGACGTVDPDNDEQTVRRDLPALVAAALDLADKHRVGAYNHECAHHDLRAGIEVEHKLTLLSPVDLHGVLSDLREQIAAHPTWLWDHGRDWQWWDFDNHLYDIPHGPEAGYVSFIPDAAGTSIIKRKWFHQDQLARPERRWRGVDVGPGYEHYLRTVLGAQAAHLGSFRRVRLDTDLEVRVSGNVHSIMLDWCRPHDGGEHLWQIELEYLHTRTLDPRRSPAAESIDTELDQLVQLVRNYLHRQDIPYSRPGESKRTWLRRLAGR